MNAEPLVQYLQAGVAILDHWQTLATGFLAIFAAWIAARPVWRQLRSTESQSNVMLRDVLTPRVAELEANRNAALQPGREAVAMLNVELVITDEDVVAEFNEHVAFNLWQVFRVASADFTAFRARHVEAPAIEAWKDDVAVALAHLTDLLDDIHRPASMDQTGEDYAFSDEEWAASGARADAARLEIPDALSAWQRASEGLQEAYTDELTAVRKRVVELDRLLLR